MGTTKPFCVTENIFKKIALFSDYANRLRSCILTLWSETKKQGYEVYCYNEKDEKSGWYAGQCCEFPEALSQGKNIDELMDNMKEAISLIVEYKRDKTIAEYKGQKVIRRDIEL